MQTIYPDGSASTIGRMARWRAWDITRNNVGVTDTEREYRCDYENIQRLRGGLGGVAARRNSSMTSSNSDTSSKRRYTEAKRTYAIVSSARNSFITSSPSRSLRTSR